MQPINRPHLDECNHVLQHTGRHAHTYDKVWMSFVLRWHNTTQTSLSTVDQLSKKLSQHFGLCITHEGVVHPADNWVLRSLLHHFVVRSMMDFRLSSSKTIFFFSWILTLFPSMVRLHSLSRQLTFYCHVKWLEIVSGLILGKMYVHINNETEKENYTRLIVNNHLCYCQRTFTLYLHIKPTTPRKLSFPPRFVSIDFTLFYFINW